MPQPTAGPFTAATIGTLLVSSASAAGVRRGLALASRSPALRSPPPITWRTSSPEQKALPAPVMTRQRAVVSRTARSSSS
jgi:hypothetical protein